MSLFSHHRTSPHELAAFAGFTRREVERFRRVAEFVEYEPGESLTYQGSRAKEFIVLLSGVADIGVDGVRVGEFAPGDHVGAQVMLEGGVAGSTIRARHLCTAWVLSPSDFYALHAQQASFRALVSGTVEESARVAGRSVVIRPAPLAY